MSFSAIWHRRLKYLLSPQLDLYQRIGERFCQRGTREWPLWILDYGCGLGFGMLQLARGSGERVFGVDADLSAIEFAQSTLGNQFRFILADALNSESEWPGICDGRFFDVVTAIEVIEHVEPEKQSVLVGMLSMALNDTGDTTGVLILSTPNKRSQFRKHVGHVGMHDAASFKNLLAPFFETVVIEDFMGVAVHHETEVSPLVAICRGPRR